MADHFRRECSFIPVDGAVGNAAAASSGSSYAGSIPVARSTV